MVFFAFSHKTQRSKIAVSFVKREADQFPAAQPAMLNFQVDNLEELLDQLAASGVTVDPKRDSSAFGSFGWFTDPAGNRVELWQPPAE